MFVIVRIGISEIARPRYIAPPQHQFSDFSNIQAPGTAWWLGSPEFHDAAGRVLNNSTKVSVGEQAAYFVQYYQPGDRFWTFQTIESAILGGLAVSSSDSRSTGWRDGSPELDRPVVAG